MFFVIVIHEYSRFASCYDSCHVSQGVKSFLTERAYPYSLSGPNAALDILMFLATELQAARIMAGKAQQQLGGENGTGADAENVVATRMLAKALKSLMVELPSSKTTANTGNADMLLSALEGAVSRRLTELPADYLAKDEHLVKGKTSSGARKRHCILMTYMFIYAPFRCRS